MRELKRLILVTLGAVLMAVCINTFVHAGGLIPGGFTGLTLLMQEVFLRDFGIPVPFSLIFYILNAIPAIICFRYVGKKFALYSCLMVLICGICTDCMPKMFIDFIQLHDTLLAAVFGGLLNAFSISLCLYAGATSGGTDFIAIYLSEKYRKDAWDYILWGNCVILIIAGTLFSLNRALYSIIFQFVTTVALGSLYKAYQQKTMFIITNKPYEIYAMINEMTHHGATLFRGEGMNPAASRTERILLYSIVSSTEVKGLTAAIHKIDPEAFINVVKTDQLNGHFFKAPKD
jgi:uncharacterized membrane-anchored protein YitT (DUF2179 family)